MTQLSDIGEFEAIRRLIAARPAGSGIVVGAGDDAAILETTPGRNVVVTVDAFVEGVHYQPEALTPQELGARLGAANLSDLAAMAAHPRWGLVSMGVRPETSIETLLERDRGIADSLLAHEATLVGGNLTAAGGPEWMSFTLIGECIPGRAWQRAGARPGDLIAVTGHPGRAAAGLALGERERRRPDPDDWWWPLFRAYAAPASRVKFAIALAETDAVTAAIDLSDGFVADLGHLCAASGAGAEVRAADWPADPWRARAAAESGQPEERIPTGPSDDYELLLAVRPEHRDTVLALAHQTGTPLTFVGRFTPEADRRMWIDEAGMRRDLPGGGYDHFHR
jgi:thiamine-monophosphate kinase